jgi:hypothetical protein
MPSETGTVQAGSELDLDGTVFVQHRLAGRPVYLGAAYLDQAHPAHPSRIQFGVITEHRDTDVHLTGRIHHQCPGGGTDRYSVYDQVYHLLLFSHVTSNGRANVNAAYLIHDPAARHNPAARGEK